MKRLFIHNFPAIFRSRFGIGPAVQAAPAPFRSHKRQLHRPGGDTFGIDLSGGRNGQAVRLIREDFGVCSRGNNLRRCGCEKDVTNTGMFGVSQLNPKDKTMKKFTLSAILTLASIGFAALNIKGIKDLPTAEAELWTS